MSGDIDVPSSEGIVPFPVGEETFSTWYRIFGKLEDRKKRPLVVLHGGPGLTHDYLLSIKDVAVHDRPVIFYDQTGNGKSTHAEDKPRSFWTIDLMIDELVAVLEHLKIADDFDVLGHSWGGILVAEYYLRRSPTGLHSIIFSNSLCNMKDWYKSRAQQAKEFPQWVQDAVKGGPGANPSPEFAKAMEAIRAVHGCRLNPQPPEYVYSMDQAGKGRHVTGGFFGPGGAIDEWDVIDRLHTISVPCLVINGRYDPAQDWIVEPFFKYLPHVKWVRFEDSSHSPFWEERERYMQLINTFLEL